MPRIFTLAAAVHACFRTFFEIGAARGIPWNPAAGIEEHLVGKNNGAAGKSRKRGRKTKPDTAVGDGATTLIASLGGKAPNGSPVERGPTARTDEGQTVAAISTKRKMKAKDYEQELAALQGRLVALQEWVVATGARIIVVFEGRDTAGKGGTIKRILERVSPRVFRLVALPAPTERERSQMYIQRYMKHFPAAGEVVIFDRSWYNRAGVERVMGFCTDEEASRFLQLTPQVEKIMVDSGILLIKYWLEVGADEQTRRLKSRIGDRRKTWKLSDMDLKSYSRFYDYSRARDEMFAASDTSWAPWFVAQSDDKKKARLNIISHLLDQVPYEELPRAQVKLPRRQAPKGYKEPEYPYRYVPERY
jgi:polyphosphate kinase 2